MPNPLSIIMPNLDNGLIMILYIHGFGSSGHGAKAKMFREYYHNKGEKFFAPSLSHIPALAIATLSEFIENFQAEEEIKLIGSSLGGYYSMVLAEKYNLKAVLLNPSTEPYITLYKVLGVAPSFYDDSSFAWMEEHITYLKRIDPKISNVESYFLLVQKGDEVLDFEKAVTKLAGARMVIEEGGDHSFLSIEQHFSAIDQFLTKL
jgi:predicted esterase YcpF (UPF0227 family)